MGTCRGSYSCCPCLSRSKTTRPTQVVLLRQGELKQDQLTHWQFVELFEEGRFKQPFS